MVIHPTTRLNDASLLGKPHAVGYCTQGARCTPLYAGAAHLILWFLLADLALLVIGVFIRGIVAPATYLLSTGILLIVNSYQIPLAGILVGHLFDTQIHELAKDPTLLAKVGNITVINGQESVLLPMHIVDALYCALVILMLISFALGLTTFGLPRH